MFTAIGVIIGIIWIIVEECKKKPSDFYLGFKEFSLSPEGQRFANDMRKENNRKSEKETKEKTK